MRFVNVPSSSRKVLRNWLATNAPATVAAAPQVPRHETIIKTALPTPPESGVARLRNAPGNRRTQSRHACRLGADVFRMGVPVPHRCSLSDISSGGCYVEMPTPFPNGTHVEIVVRTQDLKLRVQGVVQSVHPGFGMGVKLVLKTAEHHDHVQTLIRLLEQSERKPPKSTLRKTPGPAKQSEGSSTSVILSEAKDLCSPRAAPPKQAASPKKGRARLQPCHQEPERKRASAPEVCFYNSRKISH